MRKTIKFLREYEADTKVKKSKKFFINTLVNIKEKINKNIYYYSKIFILKRIFIGVASLLLVVLTLFIFNSGETKKQKINYIVKISDSELHTLYEENYELVSVARSGSSKAKNELFHCIKNTLSTYNFSHVNKDEEDYVKINFDYIFGVEHKNNQDNLDQKALIYTEFLVEGTPDF